MTKLADFWRGDTKEIKLTFTDKNNVALDVTAWILTWTFKKELSDSVPAAQIVTTAGDNPLDEPLSGIIWLVLPSDISETLTPGSYFYDIERKIPGTPPIVKTIMPEKPTDKLKVYEDVTRP